MILTRAGGKRLAKVTVDRGGPCGDSDYVDRTELAAQKMRRACEVETFHLKEGTGDRALPRIRGLKQSWRPGFTPSSGWALGPCTAASWDFCCPLLRPASMMLSIPTRPSRSPRLPKTLSVALRLEVQCWVSCMRLAKEITNLPLSI